MLPSDSQTMAQYCSSTLIAKHSQHEALNQCWFNAGPTYVTLAHCLRCLMEGIFWEGGVDYWSVAYSGGEGGYILEGGLDSGRDAYLKGRHILGGRGRFWEGVIDSV